MSSPTFDDFAARRVDLTLVERYRAGGEDGGRAGNELVRRHAKWCRDFARRWAKRPHELDDYMQVCVVALIEAIDTWVPEKGGLRTHAIWYLRDAVQRECAGSRTVYVPYALLKRMQRAYRESVPTTPSAMKEAGILPANSEIQDGALIGHGTSLDASISVHFKGGESYDAQATFGDQIIDESADTDTPVIHKETLARVLDLVGEVLTEKEQVVIVRRLAGETQAEIAADSKVTKAAISLREIVAVKKLCHAARLRGWLR